MLQKCHFQASAGMRPLRSGLYSAAPDGWMVAGSRVRGNDGRGPTPHRRRGPPWIGWSDDAAGPCIQFARGRRVLSGSCSQPVIRGKPGQEILSADCLRCHSKVTTLLGKPLLTRISCLAYDAGSVRPATEPGRGAAEVGFQDSESLKLHKLPLDFS